MGERRARGGEVGLQLETELLLFCVACLAVVSWHSCFVCWARSVCARVGFVGPKRAARVGVESKSGPGAGPEKIAGTGASHGWRVALCGACAVWYPGEPVCVCERGDFARVGFVRPKRAARVGVESKSGPGNGPENIAGTGTSRGWRVALCGACAVWHPGETMCETSAAESQSFGLVGRGEAACCCQAGKAVCEAGKAVSPGDAASCCRADKAVSLGGAACCCLAYKAVSRGARCFRSAGSKPPGTMCSSAPIELTISQMRTHRARTPRPGGW